MPKMDKNLGIHYTAGNGEQELREEVSKLYSGLTSENILITNGTTEANFITTNYLLGPTDEIVLIMPTYPQILGLVRAIGARIKKFNITEENAEDPDLDELKEVVSRKTKAILFTNPNNPIGYVFNEKQLKTICEIAQDAGALVWADEIFRGLEYEGQTPPTVLDLYEKAIVTSGLSKMGLAGLRVGWVASNNVELLNGIWTVKDYTTTCNAAISEHVAALALKDDNIKNLQDRCKKIAMGPLNILAKWIEAHKEAFQWLKPRAGYVAFPKLRNTRDATRFCEELIEQKGVLVTPGECFEFADHIRIGYGKVDNTTMEKALVSIDALLRDRKVGTS